MLKRMIITPSFVTFKKWFKLLISGVSLVLLSACSSTDVRLNLSASADLNANNHNEPLPVMVRLYQLSSVDAFRNASFEQLWQADELILGTDLVDKKELTVKPSAELSYELEQVDGAEYVAIFVMYRNIEQDSWRWLHRLDNGVLFSGSEFELRLLNNKIHYSDY